MNRRNFVKRAGLFVPGALLYHWTQPAIAASTIITRVISAANQNAIQMANSTWARPVAFPASWTKIRVGMRFHFTDTGAGLTGNPVMVMGLCSGTTNQYGDATTTHFVGCAWDQSTWARIGANEYTPGAAFANSAPVARKRISTTNTDSAILYGAFGGNYFTNQAAAAAADRMVTFLDITKGSPNYTFHIPFAQTSSGGVPGDVSAANFLLYMGQTNPAPSENNYSVANPADQTLAVNEGANGTLNAVNLYWNRADLSIEITDIALAVLA